MKNSGKLLSLILAGILCASAMLSSCNNVVEDESDDTTKATDTTTAETTTPETELTDGLPDTQMDGFALHILHDDGSISWAEVRLDITDDDVQGEVLNDAIYDRNLYIEDRFDAVVDITREKMATSIAAMPILLLQVIVHTTLL